jgi:hypothetical protein
VVQEVLLAVIRILIRMPTLDCLTPGYDSLREARAVRDAIRTSPTDCAARSAPVASFTA